MPLALIIKGIDCVTVAQHFTEKGFIEVNRKRLSITNTPRKSRDSEVTPRTPKDVSPMPTTVEVSGIPEATSEDYLRMYFESEKRSGGGEVVHLQYNQTQRTAIVTFLNHTGRPAVNFQHLCRVSRCDWVNVDHSVALCLNKPSYNASLFMHVCCAWDNKKAVLSQR